MESLYDWRDFFPKAPSEGSAITISELQSQFADLATHVGYAIKNEAQCDVVLQKLLEAKMLSIQMITHPKE